MRPSRELDAVEIRVLGALLEKEQTTPDAYPLTLNALLAACTQRSNRDPVMQLESGDVAGALDRLHEEVLVWPVQGARSDRWRHALDRRWELDGPRKAVLTLLLLRGPQTPGELRARSERMHPFSSTDEVERVLEGLAEGAEPLVTVLPRAPGQKEARWAQLVGGAPAEPAATSAEPAGPREPSLRDRVAELEARVARMEAVLRERGLVE
jgi:uncharacterized protein YceH (UPF0502 family)